MSLYAWPVGLLVGRTIIAPVSPISTCRSGRDALLYRNVPGRDAVTVYVTEPPVAASSVIGPWTHNAGVPAHVATTPSPATASDTRWLNWAGRLLTTVIETGPGAGTISVGAGYCAWPPPESKPQK